MKKLCLLIVFVAAGSAAGLDHDALCAYKKGKYTKAATLAKQSCMQNSAVGCGNLGYMYEKGKGVDQNKQKAKKLYRQACSRGHDPACAKLQ